MKREILFFLIITLLFLIGCNNQIKERKTDKVITTNIENMEWTTTNLKTLTYRNGDSISDFDMFILREDNSLEILEVFYNWTAVSDVRGLAPHGFHIPEIREWQLLEKKIGEGAKQKLKSRQGWNDSEFGGNGTDDYGMNIYSLGWASRSNSKYEDKNHYNDLAYKFIDLRGEIAYFWTSPPIYSVTTKATVITFRNDENGFRYDFVEPSHYFSIRLVKDY
ncbi:MAG: fibrobacter succinogenes major paralogous domain-containing protein [Aequorivita sp.]|nr:fibrobacter succinogenes major paralogous domain-containing protein [Aequorivita sp.]